MSLTPREQYEQMLAGEEPTGMDAIHAKIAETILVQQAKWLTEEDGTEGFTTTPAGTEPWALTLRFTGGALSDFAQDRLWAMRHNAHRTEMVRNADGTMQIVFYVYTIET